MYPNNENFFDINNKSIWLSLENITKKRNDKYILLLNVLFSLT